MKIVKAKIEHAKTVKEITQQTIKAVYPHYYPSGVVAFFISHHSLAHIEESIEKGRTYLIEAEDTGGTYAGTVTIDENEINRLFVLPSYRGKGYGKALMQFAEKKIFSQYEKVVLSASLPAKSLYVKNGYKEIGYYQIKTEGDDLLCYDYMEKEQVAASNNDNSTPMAAKNYDEGILKTLPFYDAFNKQIIEIIGCINEEKQATTIYWLDTGCGTGTLANMASKHFQDILFTLMDPSEKMLNACKQKTSHIKAEYMAKPSQEIDEQEKYDVVTAVQAHHYLRIEERKKATKRIFDALKQGGIYIAFENYAPQDDTLVQLELKRWGYYQRGKGKSEEEVAAHLARYNKQYFPITASSHIALLKEAGFTKIHIFWKSYMQLGIYAIK